MNNALYKLQTFVLFVGTVFSWTTVFSDFSHFYNIYGSVTKIAGCTIPNPVTTPCFYGALAFLIAFIWSISILSKKLKGTNIAKAQKGLRTLLIAGTIFAWSNFGFEAYKFYASSSVEKTSCSGVTTQNVFLTPCFYGSVIYLTALIVSLLIAKKTSTRA
ncbi:MAG: hypothetical protein WC243_04190 [Patescibacteria group bacterium]|jgi:hypothetical protein